jgi:plasmid stability protein
VLGHTVQAEKAVNLSHEDIQRGVLAETMAGESEPIVIPRAVIKEIDMENNRITILKYEEEDQVENHLILNIIDDTVIRCEGGKEDFEIKDLKLGMQIGVKHSQRMTFSLPPQAAAIEITILR